MNTTNSPLSGYGINPTSVPMPQAGIKPISTSLPYLGFAESKQGGRAENQDCCGYADTKYGLLVVVCDGMGGGPGGRTASFLAVNGIIESVKTAPLEESPKVILQKAIEDANVILLNKVEEDESLRGMGTTAVAILFSEESAVLAHVGDSRIYQLRHSKMIFRTQDHSQVAELVRKKIITEEQARLSSNSNIITRAIGTGGLCEVDIEEVPYEKKDRFVLCTDGIWGSMPENQLIKAFTEKESLSGTVDRLSVKVDELGFAEGGYHDNHTIALIETQCNSKLKPKMSTRTKILLYALVALSSISILMNVFLLSARINTTQEIPTSDEGITAEEIEARVSYITDSLNKINEVNTNRLQEALATLNQMQMAYRADLEKMKATQDSIVASAASRSIKDLDLYEALGEITNELIYIKDSLVNKHSKKDLETRKKHRDDVLEKAKTLIPRIPENLQPEWTEKVIAEMAKEQCLIKETRDKQVAGQYNEIIKSINMVRSKILN